MLQTPLLAAQLRMWNPGNQQSGKVLPTARPRKQASSENLHEKTVGQQWIPARGAVPQVTCRGAFPSSELVYHAVPNSAAFSGKRVLDIVYQRRSSSLCGVYELKFQTCFADCQPIIATPTYPATSKRGITLSCHTIPCHKQPIPHRSVRGDFFARGSVHKTPTAKEKCQSIRHGGCLG